MVSFTEAEWYKVHRYRHRALQKLLHNWPALVTAFTDFLSSQCNNKNETRAKVTRILNKLKSYRFLCTMAADLDIVANVTPLSMIFENNSLTAYEVVPAIRETIAQLETLSEESAYELSKESFLHMFKIKDEDDEDEDEDENYCHCILCKS